ncbi:hypothetical protein LMG3431_01568 [Achromobacter pestifer]|uniref:Uncharacterized protein n=1 Tax=Achromobacter pestifer TaxID=1353889 RepID=A0A6S6ZTN5_9BURK|nr:hypothetical protein LMG3431_01568 [Achromobacter pestifer]
MQRHSLNLSVPRNKGSVFRRRIEHSHSSRECGFFFVGLKPAHTNLSATR